MNKNKRKKVCYMANLKLDLKNSEITEKMILEYKE